MDKKATNLNDALQAFGPPALEFGSEDHPYYVKRDDEPLREIRTLLLAQPTPAKFLLAGHRGSGKSTELNRLAAQTAVRDRYEVIKFSVQELLDLVDLNYIDLLFMLVAVTFDQLVNTSSPIVLPEEIVDQLDRWRRTVSEKVSESSEGVEVAVEAGAQLGLLKAFFAKIQGRLRLEHKTRKVTREKIEPELSDFLKAVELFYTEVDAALAERGKRLLLIIEDLDKIPDMKKARVLFREKGSYLVHPPCSILYTVPIALHYDPEFLGIARNFGHSLVLPNIPLRHRNGEPYPRGEHLMRSFVDLRIAPALLEADTLAAAVAASGGVFQQIQRLMEKACLRALSFEQETISKNDVEFAARDLRFELERALASKHYEELDKVEHTGDAPADSTVVNLLHSLHLMTELEKRKIHGCSLVNCSLSPVGKWLAATSTRRPVRSKKRSPSRGTSMTRSYVCAPASIGRASYSPEGECQKPSTPRRRPAPAQLNRASYPLTCTRAT